MHTRMRRTKARAICGVDPLFRAHEKRTVTQRALSFQTTPSLDSLSSLFTKGQSPTPLPSWSALQVLLLEACTRWMSGCLRTVIATTADLSVTILPARKAARVQASYVSYFSCCESFADMD